MGMKSLKYELSRILSDSSLFDEDKFPRLSLDPSLDVGFIDVGFIARVLEREMTQDGVPITDSGYIRPMRVRVR